MFNKRGRLNTIVWLTAIFSLTLISSGSAEWTPYTMMNSPLETDLISSLSVSPDGKVLIGSNGEGLYVLDGDQWSIYNENNAGVPIDYPFSLAYFQDTLFIGSASGNLDIQPLGQGLSILDLADSAWLPLNGGLEINPIITGVVITPSYRAVSTYGGGLTIFNDTGWIRYQTGLRTEFTYADSLQQTFTVTPGTYIPTDYLRGLDYDSKNNILWIATLSGGAVAYNGTTWDKYNLDNSGLPSNRIQLIKADPAHNAVYFGTFGFGLARKIGDDWTVYNIGNSPLLSNYIYSLQINPHDGALWIGTNYAINVIGPDDQWSAYVPPDSGLVWGDFYSGIVFDSLNNVWVSTFGGGIASMPLPYSPPPEEDSLAVDVTSLKFLFRQPRHHDVVWFRANLEPNVELADTDNVAIEITSSLGEVYNWDYSFGQFYRIFHGWGLEIYSFLDDRALMLLTYQNRRDRIKLLLIDWNPQLDRDNIQYELGMRVAMGNYVGHDSVYIGPADPSCDPDADTLDCQSGDLLLATGFYPVAVNIDDDPPATPAAIAIPYNHPNPFNPSTVISFSVAEPAMVKLNVYDVLGRVVTQKQAYFTSGNHAFNWDGSGKSSGVYFFTIQINDEIYRGSMTLLK